MENNKPNVGDYKNKDNQPEEKSWFERNLWWIAVGAAIFLLRMCSQLSH